MIIRFSCFTSPFTVITILVILIPSDPSDEGVGSSPSRIILFGTILAEIPADTPTIPSVVPTLPHTSPFLCTNSSKTSSYSFEIPPSQDPYKVMVARWRSRVAAHSSPPSSHTHDSPPIVRFLTSRYPPDHSSSDHFSSDDSSLDSSLNSSSDYSSDSSSCHSLPGHSFSHEDSSFDAPATISIGPSRKRCRSSVTLLLIVAPTLRALSPLCADLLPPRKRIRGSVTISDYADSTEESYEADTEPGINSDIQADIDADTTAADAATTIESDIGAEVGIGIESEDEVEEETESRDKGTTKIRIDKIDEPVVPDDIPMPVTDKGSREYFQIGLDVVIKELYDHMLKLPVQRIVGIEEEQKAQEGRAVTEEA
ncbi:hypothetical protein Tco_0201502 [Tanacetum coccineum]